MDMYGNIIEKSVYIKFNTADADNFPLHYLLFRINYVNLRVIMYSNDFKMSRRIM